MFKGIRLKITLLCTALIILTELCTGLYGIFSAADFYHDRFNNVISSVFSDSVKQELTNAANAVDVAQSGQADGEIVMTETAADNVQKIKDTVMKYSGILSLDGSNLLCILDGNGAVLYSSHNTGATEASPAIEKAMAGSETIRNSLGADYLDYALPLKSGETVKYIIYLKDTLSQQHAVVKKMTAALVISILASLLLSLLFCMIISNTVTVPIKQLCKKAKRLAEGDHSALSPSKDSDEIGMLTNALLYISDARRQHEEKERTEKQKIEKILQNMTDGLMAFDTKGNLTLINREAQRLLNRRFVDDISFNSFFQEINADITLESLQYLPNENPDERTIKLNNHSLQFNFAVFSPNTPEGGVIVIIHDVTKHTKLEQARRDFVANVSHELRTPLTVIKSYSDILSSTPNAAPEVQEKFLGVISSETDRMTAIISDLLTLSKLDENVAYNPDEEIDIKQMLENLVDRLAPQAADKEQELKYTTVNELPIIRGDKDGLDRVFINVISNALKYTGHGGHINIYASNIYNDIVVKVADDGIGIPEANLPHIFDRFYRVDKARSRDKGGTGLGLAIAKQLIETSFNGKITITSEFNKGTEVVITIPVPKKI